jgi:hypothetical protein
MTIELGVSARALFDLFDSRQVSSGMSREVPGGAMIRLGEMPMQKSDLPIQATAFVPILVTIGSGVAINLFSSWLYEKLKGEDKARRMMTINRKVVEVTTPEAMVKIRKRSRSRSRIGSDSSL